MLLRQNNQETQYIQLDCHPANNGDVSVLGEFLGLMHKYTNKIKYIK